MQDPKSHLKAAFFRLPRPPSKDGGTPRGEGARMVHVTLRKHHSFSAIVLLFCVVLPAPALFGSDDKAAAQAGANLFQTKGCAHCHGEGGVGGKKAPSLLDLPKSKQWTPEKITNQIMNGGQKMPAFYESLTDPEVAQLVAYLRAKNRPTPTVSSPPPAAPVSDDK